MPKIGTSNTGSGVQVDPSTNTPAELPKNEQGSPNVQDDTSIPGTAVVESADTSMAPPLTVSAATKESTISHEGSNKRLREEDDDPEGQGSPKKIDTKSGES